MLSKITHPVIPAPEEIKPVLKMVLSEGDWYSSEPRYICHYLVGLKCVRKPLLRKAIKHIQTSIQGHASFGAWINTNTHAAYTSDRQDNVHRKQWLEWLLES